MKKDSWIGTCLVVCGLIMCLLTSRITATGQATANDIGSKFFPYLASIGLILCGIGIIATGKKECREKEPFMPKGGLKRMSILIVVMAAYVLLLNIVGFLIASPVFLFVLVKILAGEKRVSPMFNISFSVLMTAFVHVFFVHVLNILLPVFDLF